MSLLLPPKLLILDEPFTGVDPLGKHQMYKLIRETEDLTLLYTTHKIEEAEALATDVIVMDKGKI